MGNPTALKCILAGCPHEAAAPSSYCVFHKTPTDREREALTSKEESMGTNSRRGAPMGSSKPASPETLVINLACHLADCWRSGRSIYISENSMRGGADRSSPWAELLEAVWALRPPVETSGEHHGLDNARQVFFYEQDFYVLSNFSAFCVHWRGKAFFTSEHAYHWARFDLPEGRGVLLQDCVQRAASAHEAFKFAQAEKSKQRADWDAIKLDTMREILREKAAQHEYVARKLEATGDRELIENSWRDDFWGWGPNRDGKNMLGKLWMEIRAERRAVKSDCNSSASTGGGASPSRPPTSPVECPKCRTQLAFEGDVCGLCQESANAPINS